DLIRASGNGFRHYFVTDLNVSVHCGEDGHGVVYFVDRSGQCVLRVSRRWIAYADVSGTWFPLRLLARKLLSQSASVKHWREVFLIQPELLRLSQCDPRIAVMTYDMFVPWTYEPPDLIKVANLLNPSYFSEEQLRKAVRIQCSNLATDGRLLIVDN